MVPVLSAANIDRPIVISGPVSQPAGRAGNRPVDDTARCGGLTMHLTKPVRIGAARLRWRHG